MDVVFIDQNKWIDLARVRAGKGESAAICSLYDELNSAVAGGQVLFPLTVSHILETSKRNEPHSRAHLANVQATFSKGYVFRSRKARLLMEMRCALKRLFGEPPIELPQHWAVAHGFMQAYEPFDEMFASPSEVQRSRFLNLHIDPMDQLYDYLANQDDSARRSANSAFTSESTALVHRLEKRRQHWSVESKEVQRRAYAALLFLDHQGYIAHELESIGRSVDEMKALGSSAIVQFMSDVPTLAVEVELSIRLESQSRAIHENDIRDMHSFCSAIPYASRVIAENTFVTLARQSKLDSRYGCILSTKLEELAGVYK